MFVSRRFYLHIRNVLLHPFEYKRPVAETEKRWGSRNILPLIDPNLVRFHQITMARIKRGITLSKKSVYLIALFSVVRFATKESVVQ